MGFDDWYVGGEYGHGIDLCCPLCDYTYSPAFVGVAVEALRLIAEQHAEEAHNSHGG